MGTQQCFLPNLLKIWFICIILAYLMKSYHTIPSYRPLKYMIDGWNVILYKSPWFFFCIFELSLLLHSQRTKNQLCLKTPTESILQPLQGSQGFFFFCLSFLKDFYSLINFKHVHNRDDLNDNNNNNKNHRKLFPRPSQAFTAATFGCCLFVGLCLSGLSPAV